MSLFQSYYQSDMLLSAIISILCALVEQEACNQRQDAVVFAEPVQGLGFRVQGLGFRVQGLGFRG